MTKLDGRTQKPSTVRNRSNQLKLETMNERNAPAQNKLYNKIRSMPSKFSAAT